MSHSSDSTSAAMVLRSRSLSRKRPGQNLDADLASQISFLETVASDEAFLGFNKVAEIASTLKTARESIGGNASRHAVSRNLFKRAETLFEARKAKYVPKLSQILVFLAEKAMLPSPLTYNDIINWYSEIDTLLHNTHDYAYGHGLKSKWDKAATRTREKFEEGMRILQLQGDVDEYWHPNTVQISTPEQSTNSLQELPCPMELLQGPRSVTKANEIFDHLLAHYERQMVKTTKADASEIFRDLYNIKLCISKLFSDSKELKMTLQQILGRDKIQAYHAWRLQFEAIWAMSAITTIQKRFQDLKRVTDGQPLGRAELILFEFSKDLESLAMKWDCPENASREEWNYFAPRFVSEPSAAKAADDCEQEYLAFQDQAYAGAELTQLWLLVWRTLKAVQFPLAEQPEEILFPGKESQMLKIDPFAIERAFFESDGQPSTNQVSLSSFIQTGDVSNPQWIEGFVSKYCSHIAKSHAEKEKYYWQFSTLGTKPIPEIVAATLQVSNQQLIPHPDWNVLLHRIALRLNHLLGDQKVLKRWWRDKETQSLAYLDVRKSSTGIQERSRDSKSSTSSGGSSSNDEGLENQTAPNDENQDNQTPPAGTLPIPTGADFDAFVRNSTSPRSPQMPFLGPVDDEATAGEVQRIMDSFGENTVPVNPTASSVSPDPNQENVISPVDAGPLATRVLPSAFPWAQYPLGETRASERAQSMQIAREMRQHGIATSGPHMEDVQNIVPGSLRLTPNPEDDVFQAGKLHSPPHK